MINSESISTSEKLTKVPMKRAKLLAKSSSNNVSRRKVIHAYSIIRSEYLESIYVQEIEKIVKEISFNPLLFIHFRSQPIYMLVNHTVQVLMLNLIEVSIFDQVIKNTLSKNTLSAELFLFYVGWSVKKFFGSNLQCVAEHLKSKFLNFEENFEVWEKTPGNFINFNLKEMNVLYQRGRKGTREMNLNFYVDQILHSSPPYHIESKEVMKSILSEKSQYWEQEDIRGNDDIYSRVYERVNLALSKYSLECFEDGGKVPAVPKNKYLLQISQNF